MDKLGLKNLFKKITDFYLAMLLLNTIAVITLFFVAIYEILIFGLDAMVLLLMPFPSTVMMVWSYENYSKIRLDRKIAERNNGGL